MEKHPLHLKNPELQTSPEVQRAVVHEERHTDEKVPNNPSERIEAYMDRIENIFLNPDEHTRERNLEIFRDKIYDALIIKKENFPESYFELQKRIARERGQAMEEIPANIREQMMDVAIDDQKHSLDAWMAYLTSPDAVYPAWFKYYAWNQVIKLSQFDKERGEFKKRTDSTVAPFPDIYREPLAQIADLYERIKDDNKDSEARREFDKKFPTLYAELISKSLAASMENREQIRGQWVKYEQGDHVAAEKLFESLEGKGTGWCTAGRSTAETQIESGDFYVYYTNDTSGNPTQPRLAVRMAGKDKIGEVRGILPHQGVEPLMQEVLDEKLGEFGTEADTYRKKSEDMRRLTELERKKEQDQSFTKNDLVFLYEISTSIEGFGYQRDPRIEELRSKRNIIDDIQAIYGYDVISPDKKALAFLYGVGAERTPSSFFTDSRIGEIRSKRNIVEDIQTIYDYDVTSPDKRVLEFLYNVGTEQTPRVFLENSRIEELRSKRNIVDDIQAIYGYDAKNSLKFLYNVGTEQTPKSFLDLAKDLRGKRNIEEDIFIIYECTRDQIAHTPSEIKEDTKVYIGDLEPGIFEKSSLFGLKEIYRSFPDDKIRFDKVEMGGTSVGELERKIEELGIKIAPYARRMLESEQFTISEDTKTEDLICLSLQALFSDEDFSKKSPQDMPRTHKIFDQAKILGLELCSSEVGPQYLLQHKDSLSFASDLFVGMEPIPVDNSLNIFSPGPNTLACMSSTGNSAMYGRPARTRWLFRVRNKRT